MLAKQLLSVALFSVQFVLTITTAAAGSMAAEAVGTAQNDANNSEQ